MTAAPFYSEGYVESYRPPLEPEPSVSAAPTLERSNGAVIYQGPSLLDAAPIVVVAVGLRKSSTNTKTGGMVQTYILRSDIHPVEAVRTGADVSICGHCILRPQNSPKGSGLARCYVQKGKGPAAVYRTFVLGKYPVASPAEVRALADLRGLRIRFGSYGDPAAAPLWLWLALADGRQTGYTHQWRDAPDLRSLCMSSADSLDDAREAWAAGWRTFRVVHDVSERVAGEIVCPASKEQGYRTTCDKCGLCNGAHDVVRYGNKGEYIVHRDRRKNVVIGDHGPTAPRGRTLILTTEGA